VRRLIAPVLAALATGIAIGATMARARPYETFLLDPGDKIIAETPGCFATCTVAGNRRTCTVRDLYCKAVCTSLSECKPDGIHAMKVCAVVRESK
jgi:hypothetical protein